MPAIWYTNTGRTVLRIAILALAATCLLGQPLSAQDPKSSPHHRDHEAADDRATSQHRFEAADAWATHFEDPARDAWQLPDSVVSVLINREDLTVLDIGSATGYFPMRFARKVPQGFVFGADIEPSMVFYLNDRARREGLQNLVSILAEPDDPHLPQPVDLVFICNTYHHIDHRTDYFERLKKQLRPQAQIAVVDFRTDSRRGPPHKLARTAVIREMQAIGYDLASEHTFLPDQYFLLFQLPDSN
jgi:SAM-dependent methyltransferase